MSISAQRIHFTAEYAEIAEKNIFTMENGVEYCLTEKTQKK